MFCQPFLKIGYYIKERKKKEKKRILGDRRKKLLWKNKKWIIL